MDDAHFDNLARATASRRRAVAGFAGGLLSTLLIPAEPEAEAAKCRKLGARCRRRKDCCAGTICKRRRCACKPDQIQCNGACVNPKTNGNHCGACGNPCPAGATCQDGGCRCPDGNVTCGGGCCSAGQTCCNGSCRNLNTDEGACGTCDNACAGNQVCSNGGCCLPLFASGCATGGGRCCSGSNNNIICFNNVCRETRIPAGASGGR